MARFFDVDAQHDPRHLITAMLEAIGEDPGRSGLHGTPERVVRSWAELYQGYGEDPAKILATTFDADGYDEMVVLRDIEFFSTCEHHLLPFHGRASVGYLPEKKVVGLSKLARLVNCYSRRLQIQERMTAQIADAIHNVLKPKGVGVWVEAQHFCMVARGVKKAEARMGTCRLLGAFKKPEVREVFLKLCGR